MSGRKCTDFQFSAERAAALAATSAADTARQQSRGVARQVADRLAVATPGQKTTFANLFAEVARWQAAVPQAEAPAGNTVAQTAADRRAAEAHSAHAATGRRLLEQLTDALTRQTQERGRQLDRRLTDVGADYAAARGLLEKWCGQTTFCAELDRRLAGAHADLGAHRFAEVEAALGVVAAQVAERAAFARGQEELAERRVFVLRAVRQVCADMGFVETASPTLEQPDDPGSPIRFAVDTKDQGPIEFVLALDEIRTDSGVTCSRTYHDFDQLSAALQTGYGIETAFHQEDARPDPRKEKDAKELPRNQSRPAGQ